MYRLGLIAKDIRNSVSPTVYQILMASVGEECTYDIKNVLPDELEAAVTFARENWNGFNVTMPYKQTALKFMDELDESAELCGSTNAVAVREGRLIAYNTDGWGFIYALKREGFTPEDKKVVMVGAGGVAFSIAYNLSINGAARVDVVNLYENETRNLCDKIGSRFFGHPFTYDELKNCCKDADLFINASVLGQLGYDDYEQFDFLDELGPGAVVFDVNYSNPEAKLLPEARRKGFAAYVGSCMTACQGIRAMEIWTGITPPEEAVDELIDTLMNGGR